MKRMTLTAAVVCALTAAALAPAGTAAADSTNAADVTKMLQDQGYNVMYNMPSGMALNRCTVTGVHGLTVMMMSDGHLMVMAGQQNPGAVYVDLSCPDTNN
jgi:hypothetical protein